MPKIKDNLLFIGEFLRTFKTTGTAWPTSRWAAEAMVQPLSERPLASQRKFKILELGPGTGSVTLRILENLGFQDELSICEINERFMDALQNNLRDNPYFLTHRSRIQWYCCPMQSLPATEKYDIIVCALPFLNFEIPILREIFEKIRNLSHEQTVMTYYEYIGLRGLGKLAPINSHRSRLQRIDNFLDELFSHHLICKREVWMNMLPIHVYTLANLHKLDMVIEDLGVAA